MTLIVTLRLLALTAVVAILVQVVPGISHIAHGLYPDQPHPPAQLSALELLVHNLRVVLLPVALVAVRWHTGRWTRPLGTAVVAVVIAGQAVLIGLGIGAWPEAIDRLAHLPVEFAALAAAGAAYAVASEARSGTAALPTVALAVTLTGVAALIEAQPIHVFGLLPGA